MIFSNLLKNSILASFLILFISFWACQNDGKDTIPDVSNINLAVKIQRFDQDIFAIDTNNIAAGMANLYAKYPEFMEIYPELIQNQNLKETGVEKVFIDFIKHRQIQKLQDTCQIVFKDVSDLDKEFTQAFKFAKYYFPKKVTPKVISYISEYGIGSFSYGDSILAVGLDFFLGEKHLGYQNLEIPRYVLNRMDKNHLVARAMEAYINGFSEEKPNKGKRLLDVIVDNGKKLYILDKLLPFTADSVKFAYSQKQVDWCKQNEADLWAYLLTDDLLYSVKSDLWTKLVNPSPSGTPKMPTDSPGRAGNWLGMQIVRAYMLRNPNTSLEQLLTLKDAQQILDKSKYKPKRK
jgi:hypothetical protein